MMRVAKADLTPHVVIHMLSSHSFLANITMIESAHLLAPYKHLAHLFLLKTEVSSTSSTSTYVYTYLLYQLMN